MKQIVIEPYELIAEISNEMQDFYLFIHFDYNLLKNFSKLQKVFSPNYCTKKILLTFDLMVFSNECV